MSILRVMLIAGLMISVVACDSAQEIVTGLTEADANEISVVLQNEKIDATKTPIPGRTVTYSISVKGSLAPQAMKILVDNKLPRTKSDGLSVVYPAGGGGLIPTSKEEKAKFLMAMQGEIENMLKVLPGIVQAKVVIVLPDTGVIRDANSPAPQATASVAIVYNPIDDKSTPSVTPDDVKYLVASAVEDLAPASVTVVMASNMPMRLVDIATNPVKPALTTKPGEPASTATTKEASVATAGKSPIVPDDKTPPFLVILFGILALAGLAVGALGLMRSNKLRAEIAKSQQSLPPTPPPPPPVEEANGP